MEYNVILKKKKLVDLYLLTWKPYIIKWKNQVAEIICCNLNFVNFLLLTLYVFMLLEF